jgi:hypothetical protein
MEFQFGQRLAIREMEILEDVVPFRRDQRIWISRISGGGSLSEGERKLEAHYLSKPKIRPLCSDKDQAQIRFAASGLKHQLFATHNLMTLPADGRA